MIALVRAGGYYTGMAGQYTTGRHMQNIAGTTEAWVFSDDVPLVELWRFQGDPRGACYAVTDRTGVVFAWEREEEVQVAEPDDPIYYRDRAELEAWGYKRVPDLEVLQGGLLDPYITAVMTNQNGGPR